MGDEVGKRAEDFGLNEKQKRFCEYYLSNKSAGASYMKRMVQIKVRKLRWVVATVMVRSY